MFWTDGSFVVMNVNRSRTFSFLLHQILTSVNVSWLITSAHTGRNRDRPPSEQEEPEGRIIPEQIVDIYLVMKGKNNFPFKNKLVTSC
jgi:hypothetical protein